MKITKHEYIYIIILVISKGGDEVNYSIFFAENKGFSYFTYVLHKYLSFNCRFFGFFFYF